MKRMNYSLRLIAVLLALTLTLSGCMGLGFGTIPYLPPLTTAAPETQPATAAPTEAPTAEPPTSPATEAPTETAPATETAAPIDPEDEALIRWKNAGQKDFLPEEPVEMVPFSEMEYVHPDVESLYAEFDALTERAADSEDAEALLTDYYALYEKYVSFYSMDSLAYVLYCLDTTQSFYKDEYDFCEAETPNVEEKLEALNKAFAASPSRNELENLYFGEGYFLKFDDYEVYTNPEYLRLSQEEAALLSEYRDLTSDIQVTYKGTTKSLDDWLETSYGYDYLGVLQAYYDSYNPAVGDVFVRIVKVRQQLAAALEYDSYAEYSYEMTYSRDYTPEQGEAFVSAIREYLLPVYEKAEANYALSMLSYGSATESSLQEMLRTAANNIGGAVWDAYRFMTAYELCDIGKSAKKIDASYQTYIYDYEAPFVLLNAQGSGEDYTTFSHEFGHFTDAYYNYSADEDLETAETFSQAMEFLALTYTDTLSDQQKSTMLKLKLYDALQTFVYQGAYADFEARVYALAPEEITLEKINDLYRQCCKDYGFYLEDYDFYYSMSWIDVLHFFEVPYYIISYCVSAQTSLQVYLLEAEEAGAGVDAYFRLLNRDYTAGVQKVMEDAEMENPFGEGVLERTADFFTTELGLKKN